jgi:hypothetical protein
MNAIAGSAGEGTSSVSDLVASELTRNHKQRRLRLYSVGAYAEPGAND